MLSFLRAIAFGAIAIGASAQSRAFAECTDSGTALINVIRCNTSLGYAGYYAPYAIQAAAAYVPELEEKKKAGADVERYAIDSIFGDREFRQPERDHLRTLAAEAFKPWRYEFGSDVYLRCYGVPDSECDAAPATRWHVPGGPVFQVWTRADSPLGLPLFESCEVSIAFRGTTLSKTDILTDADYIINMAARFAGKKLGFRGRTTVSRYIDDSYSQLRRNIDAVIERITGLDCYKRASSPPEIVSVGHSLGGGLAQLAALANKSNRPRIEKVFTFNSWKDTGYAFVEKQILGTNFKGLTIDRVSQTGELVSTLPGKPFPSDDSPCDPLVRTVQYDVLTGNRIARHKIDPLVAKLLEQGTGAKAPVATSCETRYDKHNQLVAQLIALLQPAPSTPEAAVAPPSRQVVVGLNARPALQNTLTQTQVADRSQPAAPAYTLAAAMGARGVLHAAPQTQLAELDERRAAWSAYAQTQLAVLDKRHRLLLAFLPGRHVADLNPRRPPARMRAARLFGGPARHAPPRRFIGPSGPSRVAYWFSAKHGKSEATVTSVKKRYAMNRNSLLDKFGVRM